MEIGLDRLPFLPALLARLRAARLGVLAHPASVDRRLSHISQVLADLDITPTLFFGPEHGYGGEAQDMIGVATAADPRTGAPIVSLYGDRFEDLSPTPAQLAPIDLLLIDLADVGARYYTFIWTALLALRAAHRASIPVILLDRPNPLGGAPTQIEGRTQSPGFLSFVGLEPFPIRHALTIGEVLAHFATSEGIPLGRDGALTIVPVSGWDRASLASTWDRAFILPSPNMPSPETALVYPGGCLLEGTNLSDGRGLTRPFEITGAPWIDGRSLAEALIKTGLPGFTPRPLTFRPTFHKHGGLICGGVQIHVTDSQSFRPVATYAALIALCHRQAPEHFRFRTERYEYVDTIPALDLLTGWAETRLAMERDEDPRAIAEALSAADPGWTVALHAAQESAKRAAI
ncbi:MAG: DUF1343 domain-containing protein [Minicystis sp.]